jgi:hypothetical protein
MEVERVGLENEYWDQRGGRAVPTVLVSQQACCRLFVDTFLMYLPPMDSMCDALVTCIRPENCGVCEVEGYR